MDPNRRFSILPFPQGFADGAIALNIVVLPRNQNPLLRAIEADATIPDADAFADAAFEFEAHLVGSLAGFPNNHSLGAIVLAPVTLPANGRALFEALQTQFKITPTLSNAVLVEKAEKPMPLE